jgi:hypothetical protein
MARKGQTLARGQGMTVIDDGRFGHAAAVAGASTLDA